ncbi:hypothetical protein Pla52n_43970 [Stieleria varia]|uniref:Plasmid stabilization system protein n=1 Tax=Stieleria varia TaxID=2528005 RepID=A0A5C6API2_9BACT|nr:hypothetical protein Pla52n_43970 [Stieleria varia]
MATERYHPLFAVDLATACAYYDSIARTLGNRFRANVRSIIQSTIERPESFGRIGGEFRGALVDWFPYVVVFTVDDDLPSIFGLRHAASDRSDWFGRTMPAASGEPAEAPESASRGDSTMEDQPRRPRDP